MQEYAKMKDILKSFIAIFVAGSALATWEPLNSGSSDNLFGISFYDSENGIGINPSDNLLITKNGGVLMSNVPFSKEWSFLTL